jgi:WD40 repeat protein
MGSSGSSAVCRSRVFASSRETSEPNRRWSEWLARHAIGNSRVAGGPATAHLAAQGPAKLLARLKGLAISPDSRLIASGSQNGLTHLADAVTGQVLASAQPPDVYGAHRFSFSPDSKVLGDETSDFIRLRKVPTLEEIESFPGACPQFTAQGASLVYFLRQGEHGQFRWRDLHAHSETGIPVDWGWILCLAVSPNGRQLVASQGGNLRLWRIEQPFKPIDFGSFVDEVRGLTFSPDGRFFACASWDSTVGLFRAADLPELVSRWTAHKGFAWSVSFSPDGRTLATGGDDGTIRFWNTESLQEALVLNGHKVMVECLAFSPDGHFLASGDGEGLVRIWRTPPLK